MDGEASTYEGNLLQLTLFWQDQGYELYQLVDILHKMEAAQHRFALVGVNGTCIYSAVVEPTWGTKGQVA